LMIDNRGVLKCSGGENNSCVTISDAD
jgi:hypothetical protein